MASMTATADPFGASATAPLTVRDLEGMPDDGRRYELIDGTLIVSPAPMRRHQKIAYRLYGVLEAACPDGFDVVGAPFAVHDETDSLELQPDVLVGRFDDFTEKDLPKAPVLAVEVLSPSTSLHDRNTKKAVYERMGTACFWLIDPATLTLTVFELDADGRYQQRVEVAGDQAFHAEKPFDVTVIPATLIGRLPR